MHDVTPAMMFRKISIGVTGTAMPAFSSLTPEQRWNVVVYVDVAAALARPRSPKAKGCTSRAAPPVTV